MCKFNCYNQTYISAMCREYRRLYLKGQTQQTVADECNVSRETVNRFENGYISSAVIFMWYIKHGIFEWVPIDHWNGWNGGYNE